MKNEIQKHVKRDKIKWVITGVAFVLVFVMLAGIFMQLFGKGKAQPSEWFTKSETVQTAPDDNDEENVSDDLIFENNSNKNVQLLSSKIEPMSYEDYGVSEQAASAYQVTATIYPASATLKSGTFTIGFKNPTYGWALGKDIDDYAAVTQNGLTATFVCKQPFGDQILLTFTADKLDYTDTTLSATCTVDYCVRHTGCSVTFKGSFTDHDEEEGDWTLEIYNYSTTNGGFKYADDKVTSGNYADSTVDNDFFVYANWGTGTIDDPINKSTVNITVKISDSVATKIKSAAGVSTLKTYKLVTNGNFNGCMMKTAIDTILGGSSNVNSHKNAIYTAFKELYDNNQAALTFEVSYTTSRLELDYTFNVTSTFNPVALATKAISVSLNLTSFTI